MAESIPRNRFMGSSNVYKYGLRIRKSFVVPYCVNNIDSFLCSSDALEDFYYFFEGLLTCWPFLRNFFILRDSNPVSCKQQYCSVDHLSHASKNASYTIRIQYFFSSLQIWIEYGRYKCDD
jgi:hypothetical protein